MKKIVVLLCFLGIASMGYSQIFGKKNREKVTAITGVLTLHPDSVTLKGRDGKLYFFFLDAKNECLFITDNRDIYVSFSKFLPKEKVPGRQIEVEGTPIGAFTVFSKTQLKEESRKVGLELNRYSLAKIFNYAQSGEAAIKYNSPY